MKTQRHLAPTAAPLSWADLLNGALGLLRAGEAKRKTESELRKYFGVKHVFLLTSGKAALATILRALKTGSSRRQVVVPAYTCFSVPSAVLKAGLEVSLSDVDPHTLDFDSGSLQKAVGRDTLAIVAPHLLGQPADLAAIKAIAQQIGAVVIEDAAQAMGSMHKGQWLGTQGDIGFFSLGRGKNLSAGSGGVIVTNSDRLAEAVAKEYEELPAEPMTAALCNFATVVATTLLIHPHMYWLPAGLPFLGLGETKFYTNFPICRMDGIRAGLLSSWKQRLEESNRSRAGKRRTVLRRIPQVEQELHLNDEETACHLRLPLLMPAAQGKAALCSLSIARGLGVSPLYPSTIAEIPELRSEFQTKRFPGAETLANRLVTLPVHRYVADEDVDRIVEAVRYSSFMPGDPSKKTGSVHSSGIQARSPRRVLKGRETE